MLVINFSLSSQDLTNKEIRALMEQAQAYYDDKDYDNAIRVLTEILDNDPDRLDQAVKLMDKILEIRNLYNQKYRELITELYENENTIRADELIKELEEIEPNPNEEIRKDIRKIRIAVELVVDKIEIRKIMDEAKLLLDNRDYEGALLKYHEGFIRGYRTFTEPVATEDLIVSTLEQESLPRIRESIYEGALTIVRDEQALADRIALFSQTIKTQTPQRIAAGLSELLDEMDSMSDQRKAFIDSSVAINQSLERIIGIDDRAPERFFLDFSLILLFGRSDSDFFEGIISATDFFWQDLFDSISSELNARMAASYGNAALSYGNGDLTAARTAYDNTLDFAISTISLYELLYNRISVQPDLQMDEYSSFIVGKYYGSLVDARVYARVTDSFRTMISLRESFSDYSLAQNRSIEELYGLRRSILADLPRIDEEESLWATIGTSLNWLDPYGALPEKSGSVYSNVNRELASLRKEMQGINLAILTRLTDREYSRIETALSGYEEDFSDNRELIDGVKDDEVIAYTGNSEILSTFPDRALPGLISLRDNLDVLLGETEDVLDTFKSEETLQDESGKIAEFIDKTEKIVPRIIGLAEDTDNLETQARDNIFRADGFENQGTKQLGEVKTIVNSSRASKESFDRARENLKDANNSFYQSFSLKENLELRKRVDADLASLQQALIDAENRLVVADVRNYINLGKQAYIDRQYSRARAYMERAQNRWLTTNSEDHPEIQYWMALIDIALKFDQGRSINPTEPLYDEMTQFLNLAYSNFNKGVNLLARGNRDEAIEAFNQALSNLENVEIYMPRNEDASLLRLRIAQLIDPNQFRASFAERVNSAWDKLQSDSSTSRSEGYGELLDLSKIDPNYPGLKEKIAIAEYDILKTRRRPPDPAKLAESDRYYRQALEIVETGQRTSYAIAEGYLDRAIAANPENNLAISLKDRIQVDTGGTSTLVLPTALENRFREAQILFEQERYIEVLQIIEELKKDSRARNYPPLLKLEERLKSKY
ncbi:tetratricopeptide repeat protein [Spirochaeta isovalerica]|nr:tetratricopeptide repeat protein [Spirochaeta isovalerica]